MCPAGTGTWVRFPGPPKRLMIFVLMGSYAAPPLGFIIQPHMLACHISRMVNLKAIRGCLPCTPVNEHALYPGKSNRALIQWAKFLKSYLPLGLNTPHGLHQFLIFICFSFLILLIVLIIFFNFLK